MGSEMCIRDSTSQHRLILNGGGMLAYISGLGSAVAAAYTAGTKKRTGRNASQVMVKPIATNATYLGDRAQSVVQTFGPYNLQRELGGKHNPVPERSLFRALRVTGGDVNEGAKPRFLGGAGGAAVRSFRKAGR